MYNVAGHSPPGPMACRPGATGRCVPSDWAGFTLPCAAPWSAGSPMRKHGAGLAWPDGVQLACSAVNHKCWHGASLVWVEGSCQWAGPAPCHMYSFLDSAGAQHHQGPLPALDHECPKGLLPTATHIAYCLGYSWASVECG